MTRVSSKLGAEYYRQFLTDQGKSFYDLMYKQLINKDYSGRFIVPIRNAGTAATDCFAAYRAVNKDHPEFFFMGEMKEFVSSGNTGTLRYTVLYDPSEIDRISIQRQRKMFQIIRDTADLSEIEREILVYERIAKLLYYTNHKDVRDHNIVGPILLKNGVCEGHNALLMMCLRRVGIPCIKIYGTSDRGGAHCWTMAWVNGLPVHCDVTWDSPVNGVVRFNYLNLSDEQIGKDHFEFKGPHIPECPSDRLSYYRYFNHSVRTYTDLDRQIAAARRNSDSAVLLHFDYTPPMGDYVKEISKALHKHRMGNDVLIYTHPETNNIAIIKN